MTAVEKRVHQINSTPTQIFRHENLHDAIRHANVMELHRLIQEGAPINGTDPKFNFSPVHWAVHYGSIECLHWLLWYNADPHIQSNEGWTPAHIAAIRGRDLCLQSLAANGVDVKMLDSRGKTPAHLACSHGNTKALQEILRIGVDEDIRDGSGWTLTHTATFHGRLGCLQILSKWGFNMKSLDANGNSLAHIAAGEGHLLCLKFLVSISSKVDSIVKARNDQGETPKDMAVQSLHNNCIEYLSKIEYDLEHPECSENLSYPAHNSAYNGDLEYLRMAIDTGVATVNEQDDRGNTPAHKAAGNGMLDTLTWLIERGASMDILNETGETPRDIAMRFGKLDCAKLISGDYMDEDEEGNEVSPDGVQSKEDAKVRAQVKLDELNNQVEIAKMNLRHLGGVLPEDEEKERPVDDSANRELEKQLEYERVKREKLESQLDAMRLEMHNLNRELDVTRKLIIPKPPPAEKPSVQTPPQAISVKGNRVVPKTKKKKRRPRPNAGGVLLAQRTPGVYQPLPQPSRNHTPIANYKSPLDSEDVVTHDRKSVESNGEPRPCSDTQMSPRKETDNNSVIEESRKDSLKSNANNDISRRDSNVTLDSQRGSNAKNASPLPTDESDAEQKDLNLSSSSFYEQNADE